MSGFEPRSAHASAGKTSDHACVVIVGGGLAGLELAGELASVGFDDTLILEAGPRSDPRHTNWLSQPDEALGLWLRSGSDPHFHRPWTAVNPPHYLPPSGLRRRLGGRSLYWHGVCLPIEDRVLTEAWPKRVRDDLTRAHNGGENLYSRVLRRLRAWCGDTPAAEYLIGSGVVTSVGGLDLAFTPRAVRPRPGYPDRWRAYTRLDDWFALEDGVGGWGTRCGPPRILTETEVLKVLSPESVLVRQGGVTRTITCDAVVLAGGTLENSRLAIELLHREGALAQPRLTGLNDHLVQGFFVRLTGSTATRVLREIPVGHLYASGPTGSRSNLFVDLQRTSADEYLLDIQVTGEQLPSDENWVEYRPGWDGELTVRAAITKQDEHVVVAQRDLLQHVWDAVVRISGLVSGPLDFEEFGAQTRTNHVVLPESFDKISESTPLTWCSFLGVEDHEGGTLPLGGPLDSDQQFVDVPGVYALGPSTFPRTGAANPSQTTLALAHRLAARLASRLS